MLKQMLNQLQPGMQHAADRLDRRGPEGSNALLAAAFLVAVGATLFAWSQGGEYHAGFAVLHPLLNGLLPDWLWAWITRLGDERVLFVLAILFARQRPEIFWAMLVAGILGALYSRGLKHSVDALRPPAILDPEQLLLVGPALKGHAFPSGHTLSSFVFAGVLFAFARTWAEGLLILGVACLAGLSRIAIGVHWPHDVLAGTFGGLMAAGLGVWLSYHWRAGLKPAVHLFFIALAPLIMLGLLLDDAGNPSTPVLIYPLVFAMAAKLVLDYRSYGQRY